MRRASETSFPYGWPGTVCYFTLIPDIGPQQIKGREPFREIVAAAVAGDISIYATWPGQFRTDLFVIDKPELLAEAIGLAAS